MMTNQKWLLGIITAIVVLGAGIFLGLKFAPQSEAPVVPPTTNTTSPAPTVPGKTVTTHLPASSPTPVTQVAPKPKSGSAYLLIIPITSPIGGEQWVIGTQHTISWATDAGGITSGIYLVDAASGNTVGWITSSNGGRQTSYTWNTSEIYLRRNDPTKKNIAPGTYIIKIRFDAPNRPDSVSKPFSIIYQNQAQIPSHTIAMKNYSFSPAVITVAKGDTIVFQNNDSITYTIKLATVSPIVIPTGGSYTFDTSILTPGPYSFYVTDYSSMTFTLTVK